MQLFQCPDNYGGPDFDYSGVTFSLSYGWREEAFVIHVNPLKLELYPVALDCQRKTGIWTTLGPDGITTTNGTLLALDPRHNGGINVNFGDGHAKWVKASEFTLGIQPGAQYSVKPESLPSLPQKPATVAPKPVKYELVPAGPDRIVVKANGKPVAEITVKLK